MYFDSSFMLERKCLDYGRLFISVYYAISPLLVKLFGDKHWFKRICKLQLDRVVWKLKEQGVPDTPYKDI